MQSRPPPTPKLVIFDLDGVVYRGHEPIAGATGLVEALRAAGRQVRFATNNSMATRQAYLERLAAQGIATAADEIVTSTWATIQHLRAHEPGMRRLMALGAEGMLAELRGAGFETVRAASAAPPDWYGAPLADRYDAVIAGLDPAIDYRSLGIAAAALRQGARFVATNADLRYPTPSGFVPGAGAIVAALRAASGVEPLVIGKPEPAMFRAILESAGVAAAETLVIGDNPDSDIRAAQRAGIPSLLVLTGIADARQAAGLQGERRPDWVVADPTEAAALLGLSLS
ncbi:MAG TPA: HAD-IIA family hydrolase [Candidatus Limnocylindrales bacterium]|nr:HAD-IIA family hydrolase [Candidatus Limnocylindrales bacterium]